MIFINLEGVTFEGFTSILLNFFLSLLKSRFGLKDKIIIGGDSYREGQRGDFFVSKTVNFKVNLIKVQNEQRNRRKG